MKPVISETEDGCRSALRPSGDFGLDFQLWRRGWSS